jgi:hypothetical protein
LQRLNAARSRWQKGNSNSFQAQFDCMYGVAGAQGGCDPAQIANQDLILGFMCATGVAWCQGTGWADELAAMTGQSLLSGMTGIDGGGDAGGSSDMAVAEFGSEAIDDFNDVSVVSSGCGQSFTPGTGVLLASGKPVPIASLKPGDKILATNTKTGKTSPETVAAVEVNHDTDLYNLRVKTSHGITIIHTTSSHLFWDPSLNKFLPASNLKPGTHLKTPDGQSAVVVGGSVPAVRDGWMWDLTVQDDHDFYVEPVAVLPPSRAGPTAIAVLVHNCGGDDPVTLYRSPGEGNKASEANGLNAANHSGDHPTAYLGGQPEASAQYAGNGHEPGFWQYTMKPGFREAFGNLEFPLPNTDAVSGLTEWRIPASRFGEFNSYIDQDQTVWWESYNGYFWRG